MCWSCWLAGVAKILKIEMNRTKSNAYFSHVILYQIPTNDAYLLHKNLTVCIVSRMIDSI